MFKTIRLNFLIFLFSQVILAQTNIEFGKPLYVGKPELGNGECCLPVESKVEVKIEINEDGNVISAVPNQGHPLLRAISAANSRQAKFAPTKINGKTTKVQGFVSYHFGGSNPAGIGIVLCLPDENCTWRNIKDRQTGKFGVIFRHVLNNNASFLPKPDFPAEIEGITSCEIITTQVWIEVVSGKVITAYSDAANQALNKAVVEASLRTTFTPFGHGFNMFALGQLEFIFSPKNQISKIDIGKPLELPTPNPLLGGTFKGTSARINVEILVDENGNVITAKVISGHPLLRAATAIATRNSKFTPSKVDCRKVKAKGVISYEYIPYNKFKVLSVSLVPIKPQQKLF